VSEGKRCVCEEPVHEGARRPATILPAELAAVLEPELCSRYAADQDAGGKCRACAGGWHGPERRVKDDPLVPQWEERRGRGPRGGVS